MFSKAKGFSDFIGFHVRFQFVVLSALFVLSPIFVQLNSALRNNTDFTTNATLVDYIAVLGLFSYAAVMLVFIMAVGCAYIRDRVHSWLPELKVVTLPLPLFLCLFFVCFELVLNGAVLVAGFGRVLDAFGVELDEIMELNQRFWDRACVRGTDGCS
ncbi:hypothetical protein D1821_09790 [Phaeobacter inhibens]|nr:hypothetical protein D1821_09790 [Phaeobacter inhibens]